MIDSQIGRILDEVEALGLGSDTVIIFSTDRADLLGAHGGMRDKCSIMCQETYHIPFIIWIAGVADGARIDRLITNMDIFPTMLELASLPSDESFDGRSIGPLLQNPAGLEWEEDVMCEFNGHHYHYQSRMVTDGRFKYIFTVPEIDELYDLQKDPWETVICRCYPSRNHSEADPGSAPSSCGAPGEAPRRAP